MAALDCATWQADISMMLPGGFAFVDVSSGLLTLVLTRSTVKTVVGGVHSQWVPVVSLRLTCVAHVSDHVEEEKEKGYCTLGLNGLKVEQGRFVVLAFCVEIDPVRHPSMEMDLWGRVIASRASIN